MYNGIGLTTPRGSATSGHVTRNLTYIKPEFFRNKVNIHSGKQSDIEKNSENKRTKGNEEILLHNKKRSIEARLFELQESLLEDGISDEDIQKKSTRKDKF